VHIRPLVFALAVLASAPLPARAEDAVATPTVDTADLWRHIRHQQPKPDSARTAAEPGKPIIVFAPALGSKASTGINGGMSANVAFVDGNPSSTRLSFVSGGLKVSERGQTLSNFRLAIFLPDDRWLVQGDNRFATTSQEDTYSLGNASPEGPESLEYDALRLYESVFRSVAPGLFVGGGVDINRHASIRPGASAAGAFDEAAYTRYTEQHGFDLTGQTSSGTTASLLYDTRDNTIDARHGWLARATYRTFFQGFLGGDTTWQEAYVDVRTYRPLTRDGRRRLAVWVLGDSVIGGAAPYFDLPATGADSYSRSARGYGEGRYRGTHMLYGEVELRDTLTRNGLLGYVVFLNTTAIDSGAPGEHLFDALATGAGAGLRVLLNKTSRTNLCIDYGWGKQGSHALYLAIQEAF